MERTYGDEGMSCGHCVAAVEEAGGGVSGVLSITADLETKQVVVRGEGHAEAEIHAAIAEAGYEAA